MNDKRVLLMILDGWGEGKADDPYNAIAQTPTPTWDRLLQEYPHSHISTSGADVGLPKGQMGNSEVGHLNIGAGRIVYQDLSLINKEIEDGAFFENEALLAQMDAVAESKGALHLMGLFSDGGVHSHYEHAKALVEMAKERGLSRVLIHAFLDGRDTPPRSALTYINDFEKFLAKQKLGKIATVSGRFYAMDRDKRWDRVEKAYNAMVLGQAEHVAASAAEAVEAAYARGEDDEFVLPTIICNEKKNAVGLISDRDGIIFFNFRADRARQITRALTEEGFNDFPRERMPKLCGFTCFSEYDERFDLPVAFRSQTPKNTLGEVVSAKGLSQLRIAETEKYAHVTFFFNGGQEKLFEHEDRILVPSPRDVPTYDLKPEMSAAEVTEKLIAAMEKEQYSLIVLNYANGDQVGHTGDFEAARKAVAVLDECMAKVLEVAKKTGYDVLITADHGNCEEMLDSNERPHTQHSTNTVPLVVASDRLLKSKVADGRLSDLAPTILAILDIEKPEEMGGKNLISN
ncbi:MAG: 2,3-bisphosphoglycerate-independent phosphoglycerate mutase [Chrysiogenetes bacterium]|nr:2,3-bisphosphoglycerate-independent phosphoglycerate mutase [Chrysiogenetes bacterium]